MKRTIVVALIIPVIALTAWLANSEPAPEYRGSNACMMCHRNFHKDVVEGYTKSPHSKSLQKADAEGAIVADFSENDLFGKDRVAYVVGSGRTEQAYLDSDFKVLPAKWDVRSKSWKPMEAADGAATCLGCHTTGFDPAKKAFSHGGAGCEACHGPGGDHMKAPTQGGYSLKDLSVREKSMVCGQCHSAGKDPSGKFTFPVKYKPGTDLAKAFVDSKPTAPGKNQQYSEFIQSKHAEADMSCISCHDPHNKTGIQGALLKPVNNLCMDCHSDSIKDMATHAPNAVPGATCASCHMPDGHHGFKKIEN